MGWLFTEQSKEDLIQSLTRTEEGQNECRKTLAHRLCGDVLWSVAEVTAKKDYDQLARGESYRFIRCDLLEGSAAGWGFKSLSERMGPFYYNCPLEYLQMVPVANAGWREKVHGWHDHQNPSESNTPSINNSNFSSPRFSG